MIVDSLWVLYLQSGQQHLYRIKRKYNSLIDTVLVYHISSTQRMPKKKPTRQELGIPTLRQQDTLREIKGLARISQAHRVIGAAYRDDRSRVDKQTHTDLENHIEAEIVGNLDIAEVVPHQGNALNIAEVVPQQGVAHELRMP